MKQLWDIRAMQDHRRTKDRGRTLSQLAILLPLALSAFTPICFAANRVVAWGAGMVINPSNNNDFGQSIVPSGLTNAAVVAGGWRHSLALKTDGTLKGWGDDSLGQTDFPAYSNYVAIACGDLHSLALRSDGTVIGAGDDFYGQTDIPVELTNVVSIACGFYHGLALKSDGTLAAWGALGSVDHGQGVVPNGLSNIVAIAAGGYHNLVLKSDGSLFSWGLNDSHETNIPPGLSNIVAISTGAGHCLILKGDGTVFAWGQDIYGQADVPPNLTNVVAIVAGGWHSMALQSDGTVVAWGAGLGTNVNVDYKQTTIPAGLSNVVQIAAGDVHSLALAGAGPPVTQFVLSQPAFGPNGFGVSLSTQNGRVYQLQYKNSLTDTVWQSLPLQPGTGGLVQLTDPTITSARFYRVRQW
jgi:alpha-tubulin suppressor-like RCC1 family protein